MQRCPKETLHGYQLLHAIERTLFGFVYLGLNAEGKKFAIKVSNLACVNKKVKPRSSFSVNKNTKTNIENTGRRRSSRKPTSTPIDPVWLSIPNSFLSMHTMQEELRLLKLLSTATEEGG